MAKNKILLIEDEEHQVMVLKVRFEASGFDFISAQDGEEGLEKARKEKPDLILLDLLMPKLSGYEVCKILKGSPDTENIPVLILSAAGTEVMQEKFRELGADGFITKPYDSQEMIQKIKSLIRTTGHCINDKKF